MPAAKEVASFVTMLTGSFKAYARIIAEQQAFGIAAQAVFEAPPLVASKRHRWWHFVTTVLYLGFLLRKGIRVY
jgi:hypothetical protein